MRCPKCGYISFDHVDTCLKCNKDITKAASAVEGTTYNVAPPSFLRFPKAGEATQEEEDTEISFDAGEEFDVVDPDLDVLAEGEDESGDHSDEATISFGDELDGFDEPEEEADEFEFSLDEDEDGNEGIDLGQFEDAFEEEEPGAAEEIALDFPDELSDISDLSAPADDAAPASFQEFDKEPAADSPADESEALEDFSLDLDLELEQLGDDFSLSSDEEGDLGSDDDGLGDLSLDDIGLSTAEEEEEASKKKPADPMDMDADLDFDLDLGGITLDKDD